MVSLDLRKEPFDHPANPEKYCSYLSFCEGHSDTRSVRLKRSLKRSSTSVGVEALPQKCLMDKNHKGYAWSGRLIAYGNLLNMADSYINQNHTLFLQVDMEPQLGFPERKFHFERKLFQGFMCKMQGSTPGISKGCE